MNSETKQRSNGESGSPHAAADAGLPALHGVRVCDLTQMEAGTACTETLAWLGAEVIKVEEPSKGDPGRGGGKAGVDSAYFMLLNANKRSITLNLKTDEGRAILRSLIEKSDIMIENFAPGTIERLGFGWETVKEINPRIIFAQIKGFAPDSPYAKLLSNDPVAQATGGVMAVTGEAGLRPIRPGVSVGDTGTALHCTIGILAALQQRHRTGRGQRVLVSMQEALTNIGRTSYANYVPGKPMLRNGNRKVPNNVPQDAYPCKGGGPNDYCFITVSAKNTKHWERLLKVLGREDLMNDPRFATPADRVAHGAAIDALVTQWTQQYDKITVMKMCGEQGVLAGAVLDQEDLVTDPFLRASGAFVNVHHPVNGDFIMPGFPIKLSESKVPLTPAPLLGAHTEEVCESLLGLKPEDVARLRERKAL